MSDLVERVARAIYEEDDPWHKAWPWPDLQSDQAGVDQYRRIAQAAIAAMQTHAAPALKPAVEVWRDAAEAYAYPKVDEYGYQIAEWRREERAAAVIEADRAAIIAAKDAEIAALQAHAEEIAKQLRWYVKRTKDCRKFGPAGKEARYALDKDGGERGVPALRAYEEFRR